MAEQFGSYSPAIPLGVSWQDTIQLLQEDRVTPVDLTGLKAHAQLRTIVPVSALGIPTTTPVIEFTTVGFYPVAPLWPIRECLSIPAPTNGTIIIDIDPDQFAAIVSPTNAKVKLYWEIVLVDILTGDVIQPVIKGRISFLPAVTVTV